MTAREFCIPVSILMRCLLRDILFQITAQLIPTAAEVLTKVIGNTMYRLSRVP